MLTFSNKHWTKHSDTSAGITNKILDTFTFYPNDGIIRVNTGITGRNMNVFPKFQMTIFFPFYSTNFLFIFL